MTLAPHEARTAPAIDDGRRRSLCQMYLFYLTIELNMIYHIGRNMRA